MSEDKQLPMVTACLRPATTIVDAENARAELKSFVAKLLRKDTDYGTIPGAGTKMVLFKAGADKLCEVYGLYADADLLEKTVDWNASPPLFDFEYKVYLKTIGSGIVVGAGIGSCNSHESKYKYRTSRQRCPDCDMDVRRSKQGDGYYCWEKTGGCGWTGNAPIPGGKIVNPDIADCKNTIQKMAKKRAFIDAVIGAIHASDMFTQDVVEPDTDSDDIVDGEVSEVQPPKSQRLQQAKAAVVIDDTPICSPKQRREFMEEIERFGYTRMDIMKVLVQKWPGRFDSSNKAAMEASLNAKFTVSMKDELLRDIKESHKGEDLDKQFREACASND